MTLLPISEGAADNVNLCVLFLTTRPIRLLVQERSLFRRKEKK
jgi:hypothetical protein